MAHSTVDVPGIADGIDVEVVELVKILNTIPGVSTASSCQGNPGELDGVNGYMGHVCIKLEDEESWQDIADFMFGDLLPLVAHLNDDIGVHVDWVTGASDQNGEWWFNGWLYFRNEALPAVTEALRDLQEELVEA